MRAQPVARPEDDVIARIDALVDEQLAHPERFHTVGDRGPCPVCGGDWHGLPGDGPASYSVNGHQGAEGYVQDQNGGKPGCPGANAISAARIRWRYRLIDPPGWYIRRGPHYWPACACRLPCGLCCTEGRVPVDQIPVSWRTDPRWTGPGRYANPARHTHVCRADRNGRCVWANCPRDTQYDDVILAAQQFTLGCPPAPRRRMHCANCNGTLPTGCTCTPQFPRDGSREYSPRALAALRRILANMAQALAPIIGQAADLFDPNAWGIEAGPVTEDGDMLEATFTIHPPGLADGPIIRFWDADMHELRTHELLPDRVFLPDGTLDPNMLEGFQELGALDDDGIQMSWERGGVVYVDQVRNVEITPAPGGGYTLADLEALRNEIWARAPYPGLRCHQCQRHLEPAQALIGTGRGEHWCRECADNWTQAHHRQLQR